MTQAHEWDAATYHRVAQPQTAWGEDVLGRIVLAGDETALDLGCGSGRLTATLAARLPRGRVVGVDRSWNMLGEARLNWQSVGEPGHDGPARRITCAQADGAALPFRDVFDLVFSTATFHWIQDHDALFAGVFTALRPGGRLCAQCGGGPNVARFHARATLLQQDPRFAPHDRSWREPWNFQDAERTATRLRAHGFAGVRTELAPAPTTFADAASYRVFVRTAVARPHLTALPTPERREAFLDALTDMAATDDPPFTLDYWRLNMDAWRP
jgi:trans-aconitate 2-methyltransferase